MTTSRKVLRQALAALLTTEVHGAQAVYAYGKALLKGESPVLAVTSAGSERERLTFQGSRLTATFDVHVFVIHRAPADGWTEENAEDLLDALEQQIASACDKNPTRVNGWGLLRYGGPSDARAPVKIEGVDYLYETIAIEMQEYT